MGTAGSDSGCQGLDEAAPARNYIWRQKVTECLRDSDAVTKHVRSRETLFPVFINATKHGLPEVFRAPVVADQIHTSIAAGPREDSSLVG